MQYIVIYPSLKNQYIEACSVDRISKFMQMIDNLQKKEILFKHLSDMSEAINLSIDSKGRINISKDFIVDKKEKSVLFVGKENI